ncbi:hypothetical protein VKT23_012881 [Stygiomarasmius scandens]|uniref:F-box domain-containing protein n=1 Tax=Marasmiellus scandens TaxID=2682957 RepID=A0ABR1J794_9AGAR
MAILSQELVDYILDFLHTSVPSLSSSSLVCRAWLPTTRYHLFRTPVLYQVSLGRSPKDNTAPFLRLLDLPLCTFRHTIQGCVLNIQREAVFRRCIDALAKHTTLNGTLLIAHWQSLGDIGLINDLQIPQRFSSIRSFAYSTLGDTWSSNLAQLIVSLPHLESLSIFTNIRNDMRGTLPIHDQQQQVVLSKLTKLRLRMSNPSELLHWMLSLPGYTPRMETLDIVIYNNTSTGWGLVEALGPFLVANSNTLKYLSLGMQYNFDLQLPSGSENKVIQSLEIGSLPNLRYLTLQTHDIDALCHTATRFLKSHPHALERLTLNLVPIISREWSYDETHTRLRLKESFDRKYTSKVMLLYIHVLCPIRGHVPSDEDNLARAQNLLGDILPDWENMGKLTVRVVQGEQWQEDSLEKVNKTIWGSTNVPFTRVLTRIGTL